MIRKIIGVTVGTPISKSKIEDEIKPVKTVNGVAPDKNGNVEVVGNNGADGKDGKDGYTPVKGVDYFDGEDGANGKDGKTPYILNGYWYIDGVNTGVSAEGKNGKDGTNGKDGYTPVKGVDYFDGKDGDDGEDGYTPVKGVDYFDGAPGMHIGPEAPTDGQVAWIDTDEEPSEEESSDLIDGVAKPGQVIAVAEVGEDSKPTKYKAIDPPKADTPNWNANEGDDGYIEGRTHYVDASGVIHKLPNKFIDADWMATSEEGGGSVVFIPEQTVKDSMWKNMQSSMVEGDDYAVEVNGVLYRCVCRSDGDGTLYLGNGTLLGATEHNNEPFCISWSGGTAKAGDFYTNGTLETPIGIKVTDWQDVVYNKLPKEYLPEISWNELTDKPFIEGAGEPFFTHTATFASAATAKNGVLVSGASVTAMLDTVYWLDVNGDLYKCHWKREGMTANLYDENGNKWVANTFAGVYVSAQEAGTYTYTLYAPTDEQMLDPQYIPPNVAKKGDIPDVSGFAKKEDVPKGIPYIEGNSTTAGTWTGVCEEITEYYDGLTVLYKLNVAGASGGTTLDINGLGAVAVNRNASTAVTTIYPAGTVLLLTYSGGKWLTADYDANSKNTTGTSAKNNTQLFLTGATSKTSSGTTTYVNDNVYIGTDNELYSNGKKVAHDEDIPDVSGMVKSVNGTKPDASGNVSISTGGGGGTSIDVTAEVGQTIIVKEVDDDGKPTKWESAGYQPRTHWDEENVVTDIVPQITYTPKLDTNLGCSTYNLPPFELEEGKTYTVIFDGVEYSCQPLSGTVENMTFVGIGNPVFAGGPNNGMPFCVSDVDTQVVAVSGGTIVDVFGTIKSYVVLGMDEAQHTVRVIGEKTVHNKIPDVYINGDFTVRLVDYFGSLAMVTPWEQVIDAIKAGRKVIATYDTWDADFDQYGQVSAKYDHTKRWYLLESKIGTLGFEQCCDLLFFGFGKTAVFLRIKRDADGVTTIEEELNPNE